LPGQGWLVRRRGWRILAVLAAASILPGLILTPARPLWPAQTVSKMLTQTNPENKMWQRLATTYDTYARRNDLLAPIRAGLPDDTATVGFIAGSNDSDYSLWRPFGRRKIIYLRSDIGQFLAHPDAVKWVVVKRDNWPEICPVPLEQWAAAHHAKITLALPIVELVSHGPETWCLIHIENPDRPGNAARP
jgi:hypothetical protein